MAYEIKKLIVAESLRCDEKSGKAAFFIEVSGVRISLNEKKIDSKEAVLAAYAGKEVKLGIRPENIWEDEESLNRNPNTILPVRVEVYEMMGFEVYLYLDFHGNKLIARVPPNTTAKIGDKISVALDREKLYLFDPESELAIMN